VADDVGMMATVVNTLALTGYFRQRGIATSAYGAFGIPHVVDSFCLHSVLEDLEEGTIVIFCGGTGLPFFTTDSAAAVRAAQIRADILFKLTDVDGVYERDPKTDPDAQRLECLSFDEALSRHIRVMDPTAFALCRETNTPIFVFKMSANNSIVEVVRGRGRGTLISGRER
jgi:uridylate kinase